jgi:hypothetical protein
VPVGRLAVGIVVRWPGKVEDEWPGLLLLLFAGLASAVASASPPREAIGPCASVMMTLKAVAVQEEAVGS